PPMVHHYGTSWHALCTSVLNDLQRKGRLMPLTPATDTPPHAADGAGGPFDNSYARLPQRLYARLTPTPVRRPHLVKLNAALAEELGLEATWLESAEGTAVLAGNHVPAWADPLAMAYAGHQFGHFVPQL